MTNPGGPTIRDLYPHLSDAELSEAAGNLDQYLLLVLKILKRVERQSNPHPDPLTPRDGTLACTPPIGRSPC